VPLLTECCYLELGSGYVSLAFVWFEAFAATGCTDLRE
jgi:hypothetical protein